ncbi:PREDICTED: uncharacterized protein LOC109205531 [Nicotiana attenuata]|uniref:uncharacterized protein LOC109205531 n=1 Tax=Nicotiana attenuata TaxID=49451 RepID=UPI000904FF4D|nr:PREDICTED: uncharacterized protein LOC109205531 [Nicotiana attenuata]
MGSNTVVGALFQEGTPQVRPPYFNEEHFSHWKVRMETYTPSYDIKVWRVIKKRNLTILAKKGENGQVIVSTDPLYLADYTDEQVVVITVNAKAKNLLYNAISREEYEKISSCETAKEIWDKLEVTYEGTNKVKETRINLLVREYELFQMKDGESTEEMFSRFNKILGDLKSFGRTIKSGEQENSTRKEKNSRFQSNYAEPEDDEEEEGGEQDENITMLSQVVTSMMRKNRNSRREESSTGTFKRRSPMKPGVMKKNLTIKKLQACVSWPKKMIAMRTQESLDSWQMKEQMREKTQVNLALWHTREPVRFKDNRRWVWRPKSSSQANTQKSNHSGPKQGLVTELDGGTIIFGDKSKGNVIGVEKVPLSSTCDVDEVYLVDELGYNLPNISELCDNDYEVHFKKHG